VNLDCGIPDSFIVEVYIGTGNKNFKIFLERVKQSTMDRYGGIVRLAPISRLASKAGVESNTPTGS